MKILFVQSNLDDAHQAKLVDNFERCGASVLRVGFRRANYYRTPSAAERVLSLGEMMNSTVVRRIPAMLKAVWTIRSMAGDCDVVVSFGADMHLLAQFACMGLGVIHAREVADVPRILGQLSQKPHPPADLAETLSYRSAAVLFMTSDTYLDGFYRPRYGQPPGPVLFLPNKVDRHKLPAPDALRSSSAFRPGKRLRIGFFGLLRCRASVDALVSLAERWPDRFEVVVWGHNFLKVDFASIEQRLPNFRYLGAFSNPDDIPDVYGACDIVWSVAPYFPENLNMYLARANRFFEACYFGRPQIALKGSQDGRHVEDLGIGLAVDLQSPADAAAQIAALPDDYWMDCRERCLSLPSESFAYSCEFPQALRALEYLCQKEECV